MTADTLPVLADAADVLSDHLRLVLQRLAVALRPQSERLETRFQNRLGKLGYNPRQRRALAALTVGAAARFLARGAPPAEFFEEADYHGRRLAKLNLPPGQIIASLAEYDSLLMPVLNRLPAADQANFRWAREQLQFCVMLTLNNAYYQVREAETQAFFEMFWAELESGTLEQLLERLLGVLARYCSADEARLFFCDESGGTVVQRASYGGTAKFGAARRLPRPLARPNCFVPRGKSASYALDEEWGNRFDTCWSIPMHVQGAKDPRGVIQFAFNRAYEWLPREQELLLAAGERCMMAAEKAGLIEDLRRERTRVQGLAERLMNVEEMERRRISRELHDQAGQDLLWIRLQLELLETEAPEDRRDWKTRLGDVRDTTGRTIIEIRRLIAALSPAVLEQLGLGPALRQLVQRFRQANADPPVIRLQIGKLAEAPPELEMVVYRLVQECLNNVGKHSQCKHVNLSVGIVDGKLRLVVEDDGVGFRLEEAFAKTGSFGLAGIRERVALLGGQCSIESWPAVRTVAESPVVSKTAVGDSSEKGLNGSRHTGAGPGGPAGKGRGQKGGRGPVIRGKPSRAGTKVVVELPVPAGGSGSGAIGGVPVSRAWAAPEMGQGIMAASQRAGRRSPSRSRTA